MPVGRTVAGVNTQRVRARKYTEADDIETGPRYTEGRRGTPSAIPRQLVKLLSRDPCPSTARASV